MPVPKELIIPVRQHIGAPCEPLVKKGDLVKKGQLIASSTAPVSSNVHATVSGKVIEVAERPHPLFGTCMSIVIENDYEETWADNVLTKRDWTALDRDELLAIVKEAGIVGMGGAAFPAHIKLNPPKDKPVDLLVINAAECEPFLTVDHRVILEQLTRVVEGIKIIKKIIGVEKVLIGIEDNKFDAYEALRGVLDGVQIKVVAIPTRYPQGAEKMIVKTLIDKEIPPGKIPLDLGIVVQNVSTAVAIYDAVTTGVPSLERVVTVSGGSVKKPKNVLIRIGTPFKEAIDFCEGFTSKPEKIIMGGPMMGMTQYTVDVPVIKGTSGILALSESDVNATIESACIHCGNCVKGCPMGLVPSMLSILAEKELVEEAVKEQNLMMCIECGTCSYVCPSKRNIVQYVRVLKKLNSDMQLKKGKK